MNGIAVVDENWAIGRDGDLLVHLPGDLKYYKEKTYGKIIVIGRKTLESFPGSKPLPGRTNIVLTNNKNYSNDSCIVCNSREDVMEVLDRYKNEDIFISGGGEIYRTFLNECSHFYITRIYDTFEADRYLPNLEEEGYKVVWESDLQEERGITYRFIKYSRE